MITASPWLLPFIPPEWRCPACDEPPDGRPVVLHHDHLENFVAWLARGSTERDDRLHDHRSLTAFVLANRRFPPTPICELCNRLDGSNLKQVHEADPWFSFTPAQMRGVVEEGGRSRPRTLHRIAGDHWVASRPDHFGNLERMRSSFDQELRKLLERRVRPAPARLDRSELKLGRAGVTCELGEVLVLHGRRGLLTIEEVVSTRRYKDVITDLPALARELREAISAFDAADRAMS